MDLELTNLVPAASLEHFQEVAKELTDAGKTHLIAGLKLIKDAAAIEQPVTSTTTTTLAQAAGAGPSEVAAENAFLTMPNVSFINPRGSFAVDFGPGYIDLRGKKAAKIRITAAQVKSVQFLEREDALSLLLIQISGKEEDDDLVVSLKGVNSKAAASTFHGKREDSTLPKHLVDLAFNDKVQRHELFAAFVAQALEREEVPKLERAGFTSMVNPKKRYISCHSRNVNEGKLFPLSTGLLFIGSGPFISMPIAHSEIVDLSRSNSRMFELQVKVVSGSKDLLLVFSSILADEVPGLQAYLNRTAFKRADEESGEDSGSGGSSGNESDTEDEEEGEEEEEDDSVYNSDSSKEEARRKRMRAAAATSEGEEEEEAPKRKRGRPRKEENKEESSTNEEEVEDDDDDEDEEDDEDEDEALKEQYDDVAEMVEEGSFLAAPEDVIPEGRKRQRKLLPAPEDLL